MSHKILVVDDSRLVTVMLKDGLQNQGYEVVTALNGKEGLRKITEDSPDLIILDVQMPGMTGYEFMHELRKMGGHPLIPVLMLTADEATQEHLPEEGVRGYLQKPVDISRLVERVEECLR